MNIISDKEIYNHLKTLLVDHFDLDASAITMEARLYDDLDIDSIDAVDLIVDLKNFTGKKIDPETFKAVQTVGDIVEAVHKLANE